MAEGRRGRKRRSRGLKEEEKWEETPKERSEELLPTGNQKHYPHLASTQHLGRREGGREGGRERERE